MIITYSINSPINSKEVIELFDSVGWRKSPIDIVQAFDNSYYVVARDGNKLIGFARAISDRYYYTNIFDVIVSPKYQKKGIGRAMLELIKDEFQGTYFYLTSTEGNQNFYKKCGFNENERAFRINREGVSKATTHLQTGAENPFNIL